MAKLTTTVKPDPRARTAQRLAHVLDDLIRIPGTDRRIGLDPIIGLVPGGGDVAGGLLSAWIIITASRLGAPPPVLVRMTANVIIDTVLGAVPLLGDLFDAGWKANRRNAALLNAYVAEPGPVRTQSRVMLVLMIALLAVVVIGMAALSLLAVRWLWRFLTG